MSQQTVGLSVVGVGAALTGGLGFAKKIVENRKAKVASGEKKPLFGAGGIFKGKPGGLFDKLKSATGAPAPQEKTVNLPEQPIGGSIQLPGGQFQAGFTPNATGLTTETSFFSKYKTPLLIGGGLLVAGGIFLAVRKKK